MTNLNPKPIPFDKRGHRPKLAANEKTMQYHVKMPAALYGLVKRSGPKAVRAKLAELHVPGLDSAVGSDGVYRLAGDLGHDLQRDSSPARIPRPNGRKESRVWP